MSFKITKFKNNIMSYWEKENTEWLNIKIKIDQIQSRISSGIITNSKTLAYKNKELKKLHEKLLITPKFLLE